MKKITLLLAALLLLTSGVMAQDEAQTRSLSEVLNGISTQFGVKLKIEVDTTGRKVPYAASRIRPYSVEESMDNVLKLFDYKFVKQTDSYYKIKPYEHHRRTVEEGAQLVEYLLSLYTSTEALEARGEVIRRQVRETLDLERLLALRVELKPILSKVRKFKGYTVQNFAIETLPGLFVCGSIYAPTTKGSHPVIICPNGHFGDGRYRKDQQQRMATLARMGTICADFDLFGWGESEWQVSSVAHRTSYGQQIQILNGITILDYLLTLPTADKSRVGVNGGSGGGAHSVLLSVVDDRYTALCPVVSLSSHFDGGCPCESGMPVTQAGGGTCMAEMAAIFAPKPLCVVSDGKDWTSSVPTVEYPYLQKVYRMYGAEEQLSNVHLANEGHDFGPNKRNAVYEFFGTAFQLDKSQIDEAAVTIEPYEALYSFGKQGELMPEHAIRSVNGLAPFFGKQRVRAAAADESVLKQAREMVAKLELSDPKAIQIATTAIYNHRRAVRDWHNSHPYTIIPEVDKATGRKLSKVEREMMADRTIPASERARLMKDLGRVLTPEQIEQVLDLYTIGKVNFTLQGYKSIVPDMTAEDEAYILEQLKIARSEAIDCKSMKAISQVFEIYKTKCEQHFTNTGRPWRQLYKSYTDKRKAEKKAKQEDEKYIAKSEQIVAALNLTDSAKAAAVTEIVRTHRKAVVEWHNAHPYTTIPEVEAKTGRKLNEVEREMMADLSIPASVRKALVKGLKKHLSAEQIIQIYDGYTIGKVDFTMRGYYAIIPDLTDQEAAVLRGYLEQAREEALECRRMKAISQVFEVYKTKCEQYLNAHGRDWRALFKAYVDKRNAEKAAAKAAAEKK